MRANEEEKSRSTLISLDPERQTLIANCQERSRLKRYSVMTTDWPVMSKRLRQRMFLHAITSSLRTM